MSVYVFVCVHSLSTAEELTGMFLQQCVCLSVSVFVSAKLLKKLQTAFGEIFDGWGVAQRTVC